MWKSEAMSTEVAVLRIEQSGGSGTKQRFLKRVKNQRNTLIQKKLASLGNWRILEEHINHKLNEMS